MSLQEMKALKKLIMRTESKRSVLSNQVGHAEHLVGGGSGFGAIEPFMFASLDDLGTVLLNLGSTFAGHTLNLHWLRNASLILMN